MENNGHKVKIADLSLEHQNLKTDRGITQIHATTVKSSWTSLCQGKRFPSRTPDLLIVPKKPAECRLTEHSSRTCVSLF